MPRKNTITRLPAEQRSFVEKLLREDRLTLDEMIAVIAEKFPAVPSRSSRHRYQAAQRQVTDRMKMQDQAARAIVAELGENPDERAGALLVQAVTTAATDVAMRMNESDDTTIDEVRKLARAAKDTIQARQSSMKERQQIENAARERLVREQKEKLASVEKKGGLDPATLKRIREEVYGITD